MSEDQNTEAHAELNVGTSAGTEVTDTTGAAMAEAGAS